MNYFELLKIRPVHNLKVKKKSLIIMIIWWAFILTYAKDDQENNVHHKLSQSGLDMQLTVVFGLFSMASSPQSYKKNLCILRNLFS